MMKLFLDSLQVIAFAGSLLSGSWGIFFDFNWSGEINLIFVADSVDRKVNLGYWGVLSFLFLGPKHLPPIINEVTLS